MLVFLSIFYIYSKIITKGRKNVNNPIFNIIHFCIALFTIHIVSKQLYRKCKSPQYSLGRSVIRGDCPVYLRIHVQITQFADNVFKSETISSLK